LQHAPVEPGQRGVPGPSRLNTSFKRFKEKSRKQEEAGHLDEPRGPATEELREEYRRYQLEWFRLPRCRRAAPRPLRPSAIRLPEARSLSAVSPATARFERSSRAINADHRSSTPGLGNSRVLRGPPSRPRNARPGREDLVSVRGRGRGRPPARGVSTDILRRRRRRRLRCGPPVERRRRTDHRDEAEAADGLDGRPCSRRP